MTVELLLAMLEGSEFASARRCSGKPCRTCLPDDLRQRRELVDAHIRGETAELSFIAEGCDPWAEQVGAVELAALCPRTDGLCGWVGIDLDAVDHGERGLADPVRAASAIAERADNAGLGTGLLVARSRGGRGRHVFLLTLEPVDPADAVIALGALVASAYRVAARDVSDGGVPHAFRRANSEIAQPGDAGAVELIPRSTSKPQFGWPLALPASGANRGLGGGVIVDPFDDTPVQIDRVPRCDAQAWSTFVHEARASFAERAVRRASQPLRRSTKRSLVHVDPINRIDPRTRSYLDGSIDVGNRNNAAFAASANLLGCGVEPVTAEHLILEGAAACGLPAHEAKAAFQSAMNALSRARRLK